MTSGSEFIPPRPEDLLQVGFPYALRNDGLANTYFGPSGDIYVEPTEAHDFAFSDQLIRDSLSGGMVVERDGDPRYVRYNGGSELISLPAILNASIHIEDGAADIYRTLSLTAQLLTACRKEYGVVPVIDSIDAVALDRLAGRAELLPPYHVTASATVSEVLDRLMHNSLARAVSRDDASVLSRCFAPVLDAVRGK